MSTFAERLRRAAMMAGLPQRGWQTELAQRIGVKPQTIQYLASPANHAGGSSLTPMLAAALGVDGRWLASGVGSPGDVATEETKSSVPRVMIPMLATDAAIDKWLGSSRPPVQEGVDYWLPCPISMGARSFLWRVTGDSMVSPFPGARSYPAGTIVYVDPDRKSETGCRALVRLSDGRHILRSVSIEADEVWIRPVNPQYPANELPEGAVIAGVVTGSFLPE